jgi:transglutaminase-like putative cysteine protease
VGEEGGVSGVAARVDAPLRTAPPKPQAARSERIDENIAGLLRLGVFVGFAAFSMAHWLSVIENPPVGRGMLVVAVVSVGACALWLTGISERPNPVLVIARPLIVFAMAVLALLAAGLRPHYLPPGHWDGLGEGLNRGLVGAQASIYPYTGGDHWVRLTLMLNAPLFLVPAAAFGFWPARRFGPALRMVALVLLIGLFAMALAESTPNGQIGRGLLLLVLIAAWLWLPRLHARDAAGAAVVLGLAGLVAMPVAASFDRSIGWLDYRNWRLLDSKSGVHYSWDQTYGPINWPRHGTTLMFVKTDLPYYWKAETLNNFDGRRWIGSRVPNGTSAGGEIPLPLQRRWVKRFDVNIVGLRGNLVPGTGVPFRVSPDIGGTNTTSDGTTTTQGGRELRSGQHYTFTAYVPKPTAAEMKNAPTSYEDYFARYTALALPGTLRGTQVPVSMGLRGQPGTGDLGAEGALLASPYVGMYREALRLAKNKTTTYDVVNAIQKYFHSDQFTYSEKPKPSQYPLETFVTQTKTGYCQQFSGSMALMLRMLGIPARVVSGFSPGTPVTDAPGEYRVRDYDAHAWVEVYFPGIGWVTFDPTPPLSPASSQLDDAGVGALSGGRAPRGLGQSLGPDAGGTGADVTVPGQGGGHTAWWVAAASIGGVGLLLLLGLWIRAWLVHRRAGGDPAEVALMELNTALGRMGMIVMPSTTLALLERRLRTVAGPEAVNYARLLREHRYGPNGARLPGRRDRRALRRSLAVMGGPFGRLKALRALPPAPHLPFRRLRRIFTSG